METTNKYYTPTIEELHDGFEIELNGKGVEGLNWFKRIVQPDEIVLYAMYVDPRRMSWFDVKMGIVPKPEHNIRVKYLDKEDIESLGFNHIGGKLLEDVGQEYIWNNGRYWVHLTYTKFSNHCVIRIETSVDQYSTKTLVVHSIGLKNKSEFKVLLKQLGIV